jgi:PPK2 family polyphosphate:nucleotide phosphotransferase
MRHHRVKPGQRVSLQDKDAERCGGYSDKEAAAARTEHLRQRLDVLQARLYAEGRRAVLVVLQGIDTSGKDGTIRHVMSGVNPQGTLVASFKTPTALEKSHDFLWRAHAACPPLGYLGVFNRSYYEDVLVTRVHGEITRREAHRRFKQIRDFEKMLADNGTRVLKFFLHISKAEQKKRLLARIDNKDARWKFSPQDVVERRRWKAYRAAFEEMLGATSTAAAPWFVVPANHKWYRNLVVADRLVAALQEMDPRPPTRRGMDWPKLRRAVAES